MCSTTDSTINQIFTVSVPCVTCDFIERILQELNKVKINLICFKTNVRYSNVAAFATNYTPGLKWTIGEGALISQLASTLPSS